MKIEIIDEKKNDLLSRVEIRAKITFAGPVPSRLDVRGEVAGVVKASPEFTIVRSIRPLFGGFEAVADLVIYDNKDAMSRIEPEFYRKRVPGAKPEDGTESSGDDGNSESGAQVGSEVKE